MLRLNASFSKKVPVPGQDYSSKGYSAEISVELPDNLNQQQLQERIHNTFALVESSVEAELQSSNVAPNMPIQNQVQPQVPVQNQTLVQPTIQPQSIPTQQSQSYHPKKSNGAVSSKQLKYIHDLLNRYKYDPTLFLQQVGLNNIYELSRAQSSQLIDLIKNQPKAA